MKIIKNGILILVSIFTLSMLAACGFTVEQHEEEGTTDSAEGTMLAGEEAPEQVGILKSIASEEVVITLEGKDVTYRLSQDAKEQLEKEEVAIKDEVTFTTYSIGDEKETINKFILK